ncbi:MAG: hypothetical protein ACUVRX_11905 [Actinomycetota bacterium]
MKVAAWEAGRSPCPLVMACRRLILPARYDHRPEDPWRMKPGLGILYRIEYRPGMD